MAGPQNGPPQQTMQYGGQPYGRPQQAPMWSSAAPTQPQFGSTGMQNMQQPMMAGQPTNTYNTTYNQPMTQAQPQQPAGLLQPTAPVAGAAQNPSSGFVQTPNTSTAVASEDGGYGGGGGPSSIGNVTKPVTSLQNQAQNPVAPTQPAYTPPQPAYTPPQPAYTPPPTTSGGLHQPNAATQRPSGEQAVNGIVPRPEGTPDYMKDYTAGPGSTGGITSLLGTMQQEVSPTDYNLSPNAPLMKQSQQNLVNQGINPMIARLYGA